MIRSRIERRQAGLPPARYRTVESLEWMRADDGARLATRIVRPTNPQARRGALLVRTERPLDGPSPIPKLAEWIAADGRTVAIQECRGRGRSEGMFRPFEGEGADGAAALRWLGERSGEPRVSLLGLGYSAHTAWSALTAAPESVRSLSVGFGARDPFAWLHAGEVLQLDTALALSARLDGRHGEEPDVVDRVRGGRFLPIALADRVALRRVDAYREWLAHPDRDVFWEERTPELPASLPATQLFAGWYESALGAELGDYAELARRASDGEPAPELVLGPWGAGELVRGERSRATRPLPTIALAVIRFLRRVWDDPAETRDAPVRWYSRGEGSWRESSSWPPPTAATRTFHLHGSGAANAADGDGELRDEPPSGTQPADRFVFDPADPVPSLGGASLGSPVGPVDRAAAEYRGDVLCFTSASLPRALTIAGNVRASLHVASDAPTTDFVASLAEVDEAGVARGLCEGIVRCADAATLRGEKALEIDLWGAAARVAAGRRLRLALTSSSLPRFARHSNRAGPCARATVEDCRIAVQTLFHEASRPSSLALDVLEG